MRSSEVKGALDAEGTGLGPGTAASITVTEVNDPPVGGADTLDDVPEDGGLLTIPLSLLLQNDGAGPNEEDQRLDVTGVSSPVGGTVALEGTNVVFTPTLNYNGPAGFDYELTDNGTTNSEADPKSVTVRVTYTITEVNDPPVGADDLLAARDEDSGPWTIPFADLTVNDSPGPADEAGQPMTIAAVGGAVHGTVEISGTNVIFTPDLNFSGTASFTHTLADEGTTNGALDPQTAVVPPC